MPLLTSCVCLPSGVVHSPADGAAGGVGGRLPQKAVHECHLSTVRKVTKRVPFFSVVYFSSGTLPTKKGERRVLLGDPVGIPLAYQDDSDWQGWLPYRL